MVQRSILFAPIIDFFLGIFQREKDPVNIRWSFYIDTLFLTAAKKCKAALLSNSA
jgi:hypothetical protein